jgi:hypothetical protein
MAKMRVLLLNIILIMLLTACQSGQDIGPGITATQTTLPTSTLSIPETVTPLPPVVHSMPIFQVFILSPIRFCMAGNEYTSGGICRGEKCGDCDCLWEDYDPPAPVMAIPPQLINSSIYDQYLYKDCLEIALTQEEIVKITADMDVVKQVAFEWTGGALDLQMEVIVLPFDRVRFAGPNFVLGPADVDDELLNFYVGTDTAFVYVVSGVNDRISGNNITVMCGGSYGDQSIHGAGFASIQFNDVCNSVVIDSQVVYEPLIHEWIHNLDWALEHIHKIPDILGDDGPDWAHWSRASLPACGNGPDDPLSWFPSIDYCEWDPDWIDCNNVASAGCGHSGEVGSEPSWYEHVLSVHYPRMIHFLGNFCRDGRQDFGETGVDSGGSCP